jgi:hypothetical protein
MKGHLEVEKLTSSLHHFEINRITIRQIYLEFGQTKK